jgi:hypothetical protein
MYLFIIYYNELDLHLVNINQTQIPVKYTLIGSIHFDENIKFFFRLSWYRYKNFIIVSDD